MADYKDIAGRIRTTASDGVSLEAQEILDISKNKKQSQINNDVARHENEIHGAGGIDSRLDDLEAMEQIVIDGGDAQIATGSDFDDTDSADRAKIPTVGAILDGLNDGIYDVSKRNPTGGPNSDGKFTLEYILSNADTLIPTSRRHGGMIISFVDSSDDKYVQYRLMSQTFSTTESDWQGVDDEPTAGSNNLVESGGVWKSVGTPISKSVTATSTNIDNQIDISLEAGTHLFIKVYISNDNTNAVLRIHHTDDTYTTVNSSAKNGESYFIVLEKEADYIQLVRYNTAIIDVTYGITVFASVYADTEHIRKDFDAVPNNLITTNYGIDKICFQYNLNFEIDGTSIIVKILNYSATDGTFGYIKLSNGTDLRIKAQSDGNGGYISEYTVPRVSNFVVDKTTGIVKVVGNNEIGEDYLLLRPVSSSSITSNIPRNAVGILSDLIRYDYLLNNISNVNNNLLSLERISAYKTTTQSTAADNKLDVKIDETFVVGTTLKITASLSQESNPITLRIRKKSDSSFVTLKTVSNGSYKEIIHLEYDIDSIQFVNYVNATNGTVGTLTVESGVYALEEQIQNYAGEELTATDTAVGTSVNVKIDTDIDSGQTVFIKAVNDTDVTNPLYVRAHKADGSGFVTFVSNTAFKDYSVLYTFEDNIDYIQAVNFINAHSGAVVNLTVYTGELNARIYNNSNRLDKVEDNLDIVNARQDSTYIPTYYQEQVESKVKTIRDRILGATGISDSFIFLTDPHWGGNSFKSPLLISELMKRGLADKVIMGGDVCSATTPDGEEWRQPKEIQRQMQLNGMVKNYGKIFNARGNHDFNGSKNNIVPGQSGSDNYVWNEYVTRDLLIQNDIIVENVNEPNSSYYYFDDKKSKIRYFVLYAIEGSEQFTTEQETWLINAVTNIPNGYDIVFINHDGCEKTSGLQCFTNYPDVRQIVEAIDNKESGTTTVKNVSYDFRNITAKVLLFISGHTHCDLQTIYGNIVHVCTTCDAHYNRTNQSWLGSNTYNRTIGTVNEQALEHVVIDKGNGDVYVTRIGGGFDRIFRAEKKIVAVNGTLSLTTTLSGEVIWDSYNNDTDWYSGSMSAPTPATPTNTRVSVNNGVVTGVASGQAVVYAKDADGNREFFNIVVE